MSIGRHWMLVHVSILIGCGANKPPAPPTQYCQHSRQGIFKGCPDCVDGQQQQRACGINRRGIQSRTCMSGAPEPWGACTDPDECIDGERELTVCGDGGVRDRMCFDGQYSPYSPCTVPSSKAKPLGLGAEGMSKSPSRAHQLRRLRRRLEPAALCRHVSTL